MVTVRYTHEGRADRLVVCQTKMNDLDQMKSELETQKSELIATVDEIRQELAAQKVCLSVSKILCSHLQYGTVWQIDASYILQKRFTIKLFAD